MKKNLSHYGSKAAADACIKTCAPLFVEQSTEHSTSIKVLGGFLGGELLSIVTCHLPWKIL
jgi:hypothetical protein